MNNPNNYYFNPNHYYSLLQNHRHSHYPHPSEAYPNYPTNPEFQPNLPIVQQNYYNYPIPYVPKHQDNCNYNPKNNFSAPKEINKLSKEELESKYKQKTRRERTTFSKSQLLILESYFKINPYPDITVREAISLEIQISETNAQFWFKNRRAKEKRTSRKMKMNKFASNTEKRIKNSEMSLQHDSNSENEIFHQSTNASDFPLKGNIKKEQKENNELNYINNNDNNYDGDFYLN